MKVIRNSHFNIYRVLLEHSHAYLNQRWLLPHCDGRVELWPQSRMTTKLKIFTVWFFTQKSLLTPALDWSGRASLRR